jgi:hypothetical protein
MFNIVSSIIDRREVITDADLLSESDSKSVIQMFSIPPLSEHQPRLQQPTQQQQWTQQQRQEERPSSSLSESSHRTRTSSMEGCVSNAPLWRTALGTFVYNSNSRTRIRSANHAAGLIGLIQLAGAHPSRLIGTLGHNNWTSWFQDNINVSFQADGPLGMYNQVLPLVLVRHFSTASNQARELYNCHHLNDQSGAAHEDVPQWAQQLFRLF